MHVRAGFSPTRVALISTEPIRLAGLYSAFEDHPSITLVVGELEVLLADHSLTFLILDAIYDSAWLELQALVRRLRPDMRQIVFGPPGNEELIQRTIGDGARAYLASNTGPPAVRKAVEAVIDGTIWAPRRVLSRLIDGLLSQGALKIPLVVPVFSPRERQVLDLIMTACSNREIAEELGIEERTVKAYVTSLMRKTGVGNRVSLSVNATQESMRERRVLAS
jgi:DNA-binding NarL/FixJ family response regulator